MSKRWDELEKLPVWKEKYAKLGVSARELYMRQQGLCWLKQEVGADGRAKIFCTDGKDQAETNKMLNPTIECVQCISKFTCKVIEDAVNKDE